MNWGKIVLGGVVGGVVLWLLNFLLHGIVMSGTYASLPNVFTQEQANPLSFLVVALAIGLLVALLFARTRPSWKPGIAGGAAFGLYFGLAIFFMSFFSPLVIDGFPAFLAWCHGGIALIGSVALGAALGLIYK